VRLLKFRKDIDNDTRLGVPALEVNWRAELVLCRVWGSPSAGRMEYNRGITDEGSGSNGGNLGHRRQVLRFSNPACAALEKFSSTFFGLYEPHSV
jgi:hypothetical protein